MDPSDQEGMREIAKTGLTLYRGLKDDGATDIEAIMILSAIYTGMFTAFGTNVQQDTDS